MVYFDERLAAMERGDDNTRHVQRPLHVESLPCRTPRFLQGSSSQYFMISSKRSLLETKTPGASRKCFRTQRETFAACFCKVARKGPKSSSQMSIFLDSISLLFSSSSWSIPGLNQIKGCIGVVRPRKACNAFRRSASSALSLCVNCDNSYRNTRGRTVLDPAYGFRAFCCSVSKYCSSSGPIGVNCKLLRYK